LQKQVVHTGVQITIPAFQQTLIVEKDESGEYYFAINDAVTVPTESLPNVVKSVGIFWDASLYASL
jgi:hypothetical protein